MKKSIFLAAAAIAMLASCAKNEVTPVVEQNDNAITFQAVVGSASTKALMDGTVYKAADGTYPTFGTAAYYNEGSTFVAADAKEYITESEVKPDDTSNPTEWKTEATYYWPKTGSLTFFSYSPWTDVNSQVEITATEGVKLTNWDVAENQTIDFMVADIQVGQTANGTNGTSPTYEGVPTVFRHKLSQIVAVNVNTDAAYYADTREAGNIEFHINKITFKQIKTKGNYTSGNEVNVSNLGLWFSQDEPEDFVWYQEDGVTAYNIINNDPADVQNFVIGTNGVSPVKDNGYLLVLPHDFIASAGIEIEYTVRHWYGTGASDYTDEAKTTVTKYFTTDFASHTAWEMNKKITYNLTLGMNQILWAPSVESWEDAGPFAPSATL